MSCCYKTAATIPLLFNALRRLPPLSCINLSHSEVKLTQKTGELYVFIRVYFVAFYYYHFLFNKEKGVRERDCTKRLGTQFFVGRNTQKSILYMNKLFRIPSNSFLSHFAPLLLFSLPLSLTHSLTPFFTKEHKFLLVKPYQDFFHHKLIKED